MNILLIFFAIPIAVIILSAIFETFIKSPLKVAGIFFSIFLVVAFALGGTAELLVAAIIYTILSFITAYLVFLIQCGDNNHFCNRRNYAAETRTQIPTSTTNNNFYNNEFEDSGFTAQIGETTVSNNFETTSNTCPYRRYR